MSHYSISMGSVQTSVAINLSASECVKLLMGVTAPSLINEGVLLYLITNCDSSIDFLIVFLLVSPTCKKSIFDKSAMFIMAYVSAILFISCYVGTSVENAVKFVIVPLLPPEPLSVSVGEVSPSPQRHHPTGFKLLISFGTPVP